MNNFENLEQRFEDLLEIVQETFSKKYGVQLTLNSKKVIKDVDTGNFIGSSTDYLYLLEENTRHSIIQQVGLTSTPVDNARKKEYADILIPMFIKTFPELL